MIRVIFIMVARKVNPSFSSEGKGRPGMECFTLKRKNRPDMSQSEAPMPKAHPDFPLWTAAYRFFPACIAIFAFIENWASFGLPLAYTKGEGVFLYRFIHIFLDRMGKKPDRTQFNRLCVSVA